MENGSRAPTRRYLEFDEDIAEIIEEVRTPAQPRKGGTPPSGKTAKIIKEETLRNERIVKFLRNKNEEERAFRPTRSLIRSPTGKENEGANSASELDTPAEMSDSGSEAPKARQHLWRKAMANRAIAKANNQEKEERMVAVKTSEWEAMALLVQEAFLDIKGITNRPYLTSKRDAEIKRRRDSLEEKANKLWTMLSRQRAEKSARLVKVISTDAAPERSETRSGKRKEISPPGGERRHEEEKADNHGGLIRPGLCRRKPGNGDVLLLGQRRRKGLDRSPRKKRKKKGQPGSGEKG
jgi:flagellar biosynthesis GTPase FlhF